MDNLQGKIQEFLQNPNAMSQIQQMMSSLGMSDSNGGANLDLSSLLGSFGGNPTGGVSFPNNPQNSGNFQNNNFADNGHFTNNPQNSDNFQNNNFHDNGNFTNNPQNSDFDISSLLNSLGGMIGGSGSLGDMNFSNLAGILPMLTSLKSGEPSHNTGLLIGLRPFLSQHRQQRVTEAIRLM